MSNAVQGARRTKGKIKPPRQLVPDTKSTELWDALSQSIAEIHNHRAYNLSFEENYRYAYNMCLYRKADDLYQGVCKLVTANLDKLAKETIVPAFPTGPVSGGGENVQKAQEGERLLKAIREVWDDHIGSMGKLRDLLKYMDKTYSTTARVPPIFDQGLQLFVKRIIHSPVYPIRSHLIETLLSQIQVERDGYTINRSAVKGCVEVLMEVQDVHDMVTIYKKEFEPTEERFQSERSRTQYYLASQTEAPLLGTLEDHLLTPHLDTIIYMPSSSLESLIDADKVTDLQRLYRLFITVPNGLPVLRKALRETILRRGKEVNAAEVAGEGEGENDGEPEEPAEDVKGKGKKKAGPSAKPTAASRSVEVALLWVQNVLDLKDRFEKLLKVCFADDKSIQTTVNEAFKSFINSNKKSPEFISLFIDENLRKGLKGKSDQEVDVVLEKTITVFRFVDERDVFERYYKSHLAKRLLQGRSISDDAERGMLAKLKVECGFQFTQKLEGMFNDMRISNDHMSGYRDHILKPHVVPPDLDLTVSVLTSTFWPMALTAAPCTLSPELTVACKTYERFYLSRHSGRRLTWQPNMGSADVRVQFNTKTHDLNVSTYALVVLLLFENLTEGDILAYDELKQASSIEDVELKRTLQSLACAKFKILKKHPAGREVLNDDTFSFNHEFTSPMQRIKIGTVSAKVEDVEQRKETMERVDEERKHQIEACVVRIMKDRKTLSHNELINEVTRQLSSRFQPSPSQIKKRIEALIEREYLNRGEDKKSYVYMVASTTMSHPIESLPEDASTPLQSSYTYISKCPTTSGKYIMGVDEAGRGPVLGPLVYAVAFCPVEFKDDLEQMGFNDSKQLTAETRANLLRTLSSEPDNLGWAVRIISPQDLSADMLRRPPINLNIQSENATIHLIQTVIDKGIDISELYVDALGPIAVWEKALREKFPTIPEITVCAKADSKFKIVGAASIAAKTTRDAWLDGWVWEEGQNCHESQVKTATEATAMDEAGSPEAPVSSLPWPTTDYGSGYPSDPKTQAWIRTALDPTFGYPSIARFSWATIKVQLDANKQAHKVVWTDDASGATIAKAFETVKPIDKGRSKVLRDLSIRSVTTL
ncbi:Cullin-3 [Tulasnella sp. 332]|nr:Cullin-3 [Tulasnella sp. 332]